MKLAVIDPGGRHSTRDFPQGAGRPGDAGHPPLGAHAFAACTSGSFHRRDQDVPADCRQVLVLLSDRLKSARQALLELRSAGKTVAIAWRTSGREQIATWLGHAASFKLFQEICLRADGALATAPDLVPLFTAAGARHVEFIPAPLPSEEECWNLSLPVEERRGIFVGTQDFRLPAQQHLAALLALRPLAASMYESVTVINGGGWRSRGLLARLGYDENLFRIVAPLPSYPDHLQLMAQHKLVWQLDASGGPGAVAGDALLAGVPCVGGHGVTERLIFPDLCGHGRDIEQLFDLAARLLEHPHDCESVLYRAREIAREKLSFSAAAHRLESFYHRIARS